MVYYTIFTSVLPDKNGRTKSFRPVINLTQKPELQRKAQQFRAARNKMPVDVMFDNLPESDTGENQDRYTRLWYMSRVAIAERRLVIDLPYTFTRRGKNLAEAIIGTTFEFDLLPESNFETLCKTERRTSNGSVPVTLTAPTNDEGYPWNNLTDWADAVTGACRTLTLSINHLEKKHQRSFNCARFSDTTFNPICSSQQRLCDGECSSRQPWWCTDAFLLSMTTRSFGCITHSHASTHLHPQQILRTELITLLGQLEMITLDAMKSGTKHSSVFLLSFTRIQARILEACITESGKMAISIRPVLDEDPTGPDRDAKFQTLIRWSMFMDKHTKAALEESCGAGNADSIDGALNNDSDSDADDSETDSETDSNPSPHTSFTAEDFTDKEASSK
ncbi:hypothetical protein F5Y14DRAFT_417629 [Nemania sp. NC0429]|nr:hypothetical protein F5Y14DRAFT_417629 [Nemania sp. NC0429]